MPWNFHAIGTIAELNTAMANAENIADPLEADQRAAVFNAIQQSYSTTYAAVYDTVLNNPLELTMNGSSAERGMRINIKLDVVKVVNGGVSTATFPNVTQGGSYQPMSP